MEPEKKIEKTGGPYLTKTTKTTTKTTATTPTASKTECSPADVVSLRSGNPNCKPAEEIPDCPPEQNVVAGVVTFKSGNINCKSVSDLVVKYDGIEDLLDL